MCVRIHLLPGPGWWKISSRQPTPTAHLRSQVLGSIGPSIDYEIVRQEADLSVAVDMNPNADAPGLGLRLD
jgi:hypothetical protein